MGRNTITDVRAQIEQMNQGWTDPEELSFECWGTEQNRYQLTNAETGETYGRVCIGATEFLKLLSGFKAGRKL